MVIDLIHQLIELITTSSLSPIYGYMIFFSITKHSGLFIFLSVICRPEDLRIPFERFGPVKDVYLPKNYHTGYTILDCYGVNYCM